MLTNSQINIDETIHCKNNFMPSFINFINLKRLLNVMFKRQLKTVNCSVTLFWSVLYLASSDPESSSSRMAAILRLETWCWTTGLQMIKEHVKKYFTTFHFVERTDLLKALNSSPNELIQVNKETQSSF